MIIIHQKDIEQKQNDLKDSVSLYKLELVNFEKSKTNEILKEIYTLLEKEAQEKNISIIFRKENILYGKELKDLTETIKNKF